jgi:hypothetical protein
LRAAQVIRAPRLCIRARLQSCRNGPKKKPGFSPCASEPSGGRTFATKIKEAPPRSLFPHPVQIIRGAGFVSGHNFSRAVTAPKRNRASAPALRDLPAGAALPQRSKRLLRGASFRIPSRSSERAGLVSGHDFSRAVTAPKRNGLQPLCLTRAPLHQTAHAVRAGGATQISPALQRGPRRALRAGVRSAGKGHKRDRVPEGRR